MGERNSYVDYKISSIVIQREVDMSSLEDKEEIEMIKQFHIKVQVKKKKVDALFDTSLQTNLVVKI